MPEQEEAEVATIFRSYGLDWATTARIVEEIRSDRQRWIEFMMRHELGQEKPDPSRARRCALTIGLAYITGGLVPLSPYFFVRDVKIALSISIVFTLVALTVFGYFKGLFTTPRPWRRAWQTALVEGLAAVAAFTIAKAIG